MAFTRFGISDLVGGVSTQPASLRYPNQVESSTNCLMTFARGLERRPGTVGYTALASAPGSATDVAVHWVEISATVRLVFIFRNNATTPFYAYKTDGTAVTINYSGSSKAYLTVANPATNLRFASLGVTTIALNKTITTATGNNSSAPYQYAATNVSNSANAHNKATWDDFTQPPTVANEYWYARGATAGHPAGWWKSISTALLPWYQQVASESDNSIITATTMPVKIVWNTGTGQLDVSEITWTSRLSGDETTNPRADFFGKTLTDIAFHRGRLWLAAGDVVCSSQADDLYNFWIRDWENVTDADPIQLSTSSTGEIANVTYLTPFRKSLMVFCDTGLVMEATSDAELSPTTVVWQPSYRAIKLAGRPDVMGNRLYFLTSWSSGDKLYEHVASDTTTGGNAEDISMHVAGYLPDGEAFIEVANGNMALIRFADEATNLYVYQSLLSGDQRAQSAFHKWSFHSTLSGHYVFDNTVYLLFRNTTTVWLETLDIADLRPEYTSELHHIHLDRKHKKTGVYSSTTNLTTWTKDYSDTSALAIFLGAEWVSLGRHGTVLTGTSTGATTMTVPGKWDQFTAVVGRSYTSEATISEPKVRDRNGAVVVGTLQLKNMSVFVRDTGLIKADVTIGNGDTRVETYTGKRIGTATVDSYEIAEKGQFDVAVYDAADTAVIRLFSSASTPFNVTGLQLDGMFTPNRRSAANI